MSAKADTGIGTPILVEDFDTIVVTVTSQDSGSGTVKMQGSIAETRPAFGSAQSATNRWDYVQMKDLEDNSSVDGDDGVVATGTDIARQFEVNVSGLRWFCPVVTARVAGSFNVHVKGYSLGS